MRNTVHPGIPLVGDAGRRTGIEDVGRDLVRGSAEYVVALITQVGQAEQLALDALQLGDNDRAIGAVEGSIGALDTQIGGLLQRRDHRGEG